MDILYEHTLNIRQENYMKLYFQFLLSDLFILRVQKFDQYNIDFYTMLWFNERIISFLNVLLMIIKWTKDILSFCALSL